MVFVGVGGGLVLVGAWVLVGVGGWVCVAVGAALVGVNGREVGV